MNVKKPLQTSLLIALPLLFGFNYILENQLNPKKEISKSYEKMNQQTDQLFDSAHYEIFYVPRNFPRCGSFGEAIEWNNFSKKAYQFEDSLRKEYHHLRNNYVENDSIIKQMQNNIDSLEAELLW